MPLDERVRRGLREASRAVPDDPARALADLHRRRRTPARRQTLLNALAAVALLAVAVPLLVVLDPRAGPSPSASPIGTVVVPVQGDLAGDYRADLTGSGEPLAAAGLAGPWRISFVGDGSMLWAAPPGASIAGDVIRDTYQASDSDVVINLFLRNLCRGAGVGTYTWSRSGRIVTFVAVRDACALRRAVLESASWTGA